VIIPELILLGILCHHWLWYYPLLTSWSVLKSEGSGRVSVEYMMAACICSCFILHISCSHVRFEVCVSS
jgi:hypothetical protein